MFLFTNIQSKQVFFNVSHHLNVTVIKICTDFYIENQCFSFLDYAQYVADNSIQESNGQQTLHILSYAESSTKAQYKLSPRCI
jgi:hypothetical protein